MKKWLFFIVFLLGISFVTAENKTVLVINSGNWEDIYSGILFSNFHDMEVDFLSSERQFKYQPKFLHDFAKVILLQPEENPLVYGYFLDLQQERLPVELKTGKNLNVALARQTKTKNFILLNPLYPHNAVAVTPYAKLTNSFVLFITKDNMEQIYVFLKERGVEKLLLYGFMYPEIREKFAEFQPEEINVGDKFANTVELVKKYKQLTDAKQVTLTSGSFLEPEMLRVKQPILFIGINDIPVVLFDYLKESDIYVAEVVGNELTASSTKLKRQLNALGKNFYVFIRFGQGTTVRGGGAAREVNSLDLFYLPLGGKINLTITHVQYNRASEQLEVSYRNIGDLPLYSRATIKILIDADRKKTVGDEDSFFLLPNEQKIITYPLDLSAYEPLELKDRAAEILARYGENANALDQVYEAILPINITSLKDNSALDVASLTYSADIYKNVILWVDEQLSFVDLQEFTAWNPSKKIIHLDVVNTVHEPVYFKPVLIVTRKGIDEAQQKTEVFSLEGRKSKIISFEIETTGIDFTELMKVDVSYGARQEALIKRLKKDMQLVPSYKTDIIILSVIILLLLRSVWRRMRRRRKEKKE